MTATEQALSAEMATDSVPHYSNPFLRHLPSFNSGCVAVTSSSVLQGSRVYNKPSAPPVQVLRASPEDLTISKFVAKRICSSAAAASVADKPHTTSSIISSSDSNISSSNNSKPSTAQLQPRNFVGEKRKIVSEDGFGLASKVTVILPKSPLRALKNINNSGGGVGNSAAMANRNTHMAAIIRSNSIINKSAGAGTSGAATTAAASGGGRSAPFKRPKAVPHPI